MKVLIGIHAYEEPVGHTARSPEAARRPYVRRSVCWPWSATSSPLGSSIPDTASRKDTSERRMEACAGANQLGCSSPMMRGDTPEVSSI